ncbi:phosphatase PAP2 family protein [Streptomyces sp. NPDC014748]|uniref:phosphatase PAP2 family protein n=1 Tax=Streptomyces sp. NPDC014748 TaxID=3364905 RepID=UPI0036FA05F7
MPTLSVFHVKDAMTAPHSVTSAFDGSSIDGPWFTWVTGIARDTPWLNDSAEVLTQAGLGVFAVLMAIGWWRARRMDGERMAAALIAPVSVLAAFAVAEVVKSRVAELRPCRSLPHAYIVETCPQMSDYAFPSGHTTTAAATVGALVLVDRKLSRIALVLAVLEGVSRVYVGAHYPHDVAGSFVVGLVVALCVSAVLRRALIPLVATLREGRCRPLLAAG